MKKLLPMIMSAIFLLQFSMVTLYAENNPSDEAQFNMLMSKLENDFNDRALHLEEFTNDIKKFLDGHKDFDVNFISNNQATPLKQAVLMSNKELVDILLENGADPLYEVFSCNLHSSLYFAKLFCKYNLFVQENPEIIRRFNIESIDPEVSQKALKYCLKERNCNSIYEKLLESCGGLKDLPPFARSELDWASHENKIHLKEKPTYLDIFQNFKKDPVAENWISFRIDYMAIKELLLQDEFLLDDMEILLNERGLKPNVPLKGVYPDIKEEGFYPDLIIYVVYMYHYTNFRKNNLKNTLEERLFEMREILNVVSDILYKPSIQKCPINRKGKTSYDKRIITYDYHGMDVNLVYPFTVKIYNASMKNCNLQSVNVIVGQGMHSSHGVCVSGALVMYFSCKNCLESVLLPNNPGIISFRIHRV